VNTFIGTDTVEQLSLSEDAMRLLNTPNAGGSSALSEAISLEIMIRYFGAKLYQTEMEIEYVEGSKKTDYSIDVFGQKVGVSVTRAMKFPRTAVYTTFDAQKLLVKKLIGVMESSENVVSDCWNVQILHILCQTKQIAEIVVKEYQKLPQCLKKNTIVVLTITEKTPYIYTSYSPAVTAPICPVDKKEKNSFRNSNNIRYQSRYNR